MTDPTVLITGVGGQDGTLLLREANARGWRTWGVVGPGAVATLDTGAADSDGAGLVEADLADPEVCRRLIADTRPDIVFHLAAISSVGESWARPVQTAQVNGIATIALMAECLELNNRFGQDVRFVNASSAEIFAGADVVPQSELTPLSPLSPYGAAKAFAHMMGHVFRDRGLKVSNAILYNHESTLRPPTFVTRKITSGAAAIAVGKQRSLQLGNLDARRDWGWAPDYVDCLIRMALHDTADDFVVATGVSHTVRDFVAAAFGAAGIENWQDHVEVEDSLLRTADSFELRGDASKARTELGWRTTKSFAEVVEVMVHADLALARQPDGLDVDAAQRGTR